MLGGGITRKVLEDYRTAPIDEKLRATLAYLEKVTLSPADVVPADAAAVLAAGVSRDQVTDALHVLFLFNIYDRLADTLGWQIPPPEGFQQSARVLLSRGYR